MGILAWYFGEHYIISTILSPAFSAIYSLDEGLYTRFIIACVVELVYFAIAALAKKE